MVLLPVTSFYASLLALIYLYLTAQVSLHRRSQQIGIGDGGDELLRRLIRVHGNFAEFVPLVLLLLAVLEINTERTWLIHGFGLLITVGRVLHAYGLKVSSGATWQRLAGTGCTLFSLGALAIINLSMLYWLPFL